MVLRHSLAAGSALVAAPAVAAALVLRPDLRAGVGERLGSVPVQSPGGLWLHGASVGESHLVARLAGAFAGLGHPVFASIQTRSGLGVLRRTRPELPCAFAPFDHPWCVDRALGRVAPAALVMVETELWPCWIEAAARRGVRVGLVSGRISDSSWPRYQAIRPIMKATLGRIDRVGARSAQDAERLVALGACRERVSVTGDLKWAPRAEPPPVAADLRAALEARTVFVAGSTHAGEEDAAVEAMRQCEALGHPVTLVVAPRQMDRIDAVADSLRSRHRVRLRSNLGEGALEPDEILLIDSLGELAGVYSLARVAFVGGSLAPVGGHDPLEAVLSGCPVCVGPHHDNVSEVVSELVAMECAEVVADPEQLGAAVARRVADRATRPIAAQTRIAQAGRTNLERTLALIDDLLATGPP